MHLGKQPFTRRWFPLNLLLTAALFAGWTTVPGASVNVLRFGADGTDNKDDRPAIQQAIDSSKAGDEILIPDGKYYVRSSLVMKSNRKLRGQSSAGTILQYSGNSESAMINLEAATNVEITKLTLLGGKKAVAGIEALQGARLNLHHLIIKDFQTNSEDGAVAIHLVGDGKKGVTDSLITDNEISNIAVNTEWGGGIRCSHGSWRNQILRNRIDRTGRGGIFGDNDSTDLVIRNNVVSNSGLGTESALGIEVWGRCDRAIIEDNIIDHWLSLDSSQYVAVRRNRVSDLSEKIVAPIGLEAANDCRNSVFTGNTVDHGQQIGISISGSDPNKDYVYWANNTIDSMVNWGMQIQGEKGLTRFHYFYKNVFKNTRIDDPRATYPPGGIGVRFNENAYSFVFDGNVIKDNEGLGLQWYGKIDQMSFIHNNILNNAEEGVEPYPKKASDLEWKDNTVRGNASNVQPISRGFSFPPPKADFVVPNSPTVGEPVRFVDRSSSTNPIVHRLWDFDDGIPSTAESPTHTFAKDGKYRVALIVWDENGRANRKEMLVVVP